MSDWTANEDALIMTRIQESPFPYEAIMRMTGRSKWSVKGRANRLREVLREGGSFAPKKALTRRIKGVVFHMNKQSATEHAGTRTCLSCRKPFESWDVRKNQLCPKCGTQIDDIPVYHAIVKSTLS